AIDRHELRQRIGRELREDLTHVLPGAALGGEQHDLDPRMGDQEPQQLRAGIARRAEHADLSLVSHDSSPSGRFAHWYAKCGRKATIRAAIAWADGPCSRSTLRPEIARAAACRPLPSHGTAAGRPPGGRLRKRSRGEAARSRKGKADGAMNLEGRMDVHGRAP